MNIKSKLFTYVNEKNIPDFYLDYYTNITQQVFTHFEISANAKSTLIDSSGIVESKIAFDLADRVAKMHDIDISNKLRLLLKRNGKELTALQIAKDIALGNYVKPETKLQERLDLAIRVGLSIVTEGVTIAPLQGIHDITIKKNKNGSEYLSVSIAGPIRSAGGTESAVTILIADYIRKAVGLSKYEVNSFDDETGRFVEELRIYESEAQGNFQFHVSDSDIIKVISNLPVELTGVDTDPFEVVNHKNMMRIKTNRVRGGALRVLNDGLIGRAKKLQKRVELYNLDGWEWLNDLKGAIQTTDKEDTSTKRMKEVIAGRSVLSTPNNIGGFRLRYGRACNTGFTAVGVHPAVAEILENSIVTGTQIKMDKPGKGATIAFVDSIDSPIVKLLDGSVVKIQNVDHAIKIKNQIEKIIYLGDILISFGDFLENNSKLIPTGYVEEYWKAELCDKLDICISSNKHNMTKFLNKTPTLDEAIYLSLHLEIALHPKYLYYWDQINVIELQKLLNPIKIQNNEIFYTTKCKNILEKLGVPHTISKKNIISVVGLNKRIFDVLLFKKQITFDSNSILKILTNSSGILIRSKSSTTIGVRIGRPEKASMRKMKPPIHVIFPTGNIGGISRDIYKASQNKDFHIVIHNKICSKCNNTSVGIKCRYCGHKTKIIYSCVFCKTRNNNKTCDKCNRHCVSYSNNILALKDELLVAQKNTGIRIKSPFKGVKELIGQNKIAEPLEKGIIRQSLELTVFKDGTIRFDSTNSPLTHFKPKWIGISLDALRKLGYTKDIENNPLTNLNQMVELRMQDIIIPYECGTSLIKISKYIDLELQKIYNKKSFYNANNINDLVGHLIIGLAPHTSVGIVGRIIGFTKTHVCFATPNWHSAKRRDADGDADSIILLMDVFLNFSKNFLSSKIGGLMDAPLLIQPLVIPHESQSQAHNLEVMKQYPTSFFKSTITKQKATDVKSVDIIKSKLDTEKQFYGYHYTHNTSTLTVSKSRSAYTALSSMLDKFDLQIRNANIINSINTDEMISNLITTHIIPDIMGNLRAYTTQKFRCTSCGKKYRRVPLFFCCSCGNNLIQTITRPTVEKYLSFAIKLTKKYSVGSYITNRILVLSEEIDLVFGKRSKIQSVISDFTT
ncbi:MAG: DNA polymerase II large subunit [Nitrosopumilaceae archaeon]|nr:DNA polymerase II large subunit [Nitrosopumilaceae archaeon]